MPVNQISEEDRVRVNQLRKLVKPYLTDYYDTDFNLLRWLQGHDGPVESVAEKLKVHLKARSSLWELDKRGTMSRSDVIHKHWPYRICGMAGKQENVMVVVEQTGQTDFYGMLQTYSFAHILIARLRDMENMLYTVMEIERKTGKQAFILYILDLTELKYEARNIRMILGPFKCMADLMADHYAELMKHIVVVNAPSFVSIFWNIAKPLLPARTREKTIILSSSNWRNEILEFANADALPDKWNIPDGPKFTSFVSLPIPVKKEEYYDQCEWPENLDIARVSAGRSVFITRYGEVGDRISWVIIADAQYAFAIFRADQEDEQDPETMETIYASFGWLPGPTTAPIKETHTLQKSGYYKLQLINDRAWFHTLKVSYSFKIFAEGSRGSLE